MSQSLVPVNALYIGQKGYFFFHSPFDVAYHLNDQYLVVDHISSIGDLLYDKVDIYLQYFAIYKLSKTQYTAFLNDNGVIVTFKAKDGTRYGIPNTFIKSIPNKTDIPYRQMGLNIVFGMLPIDYPIGALVDQLSKAIFYNIGVDATINIVPLSPEILMPTMLSPNGKYYDPITQILGEIELISSILPSLSACVENPNQCPLFLSTPTSLSTSLAVFGGGYSYSGGPHHLSITSLYTYASNTTAAGTDLTYSADSLAAAGNSTIGVFGGGSPGPLSTTSIYTYLSNTTAVGANLTYSADLLAATGNSTLGVFGGGFNGPVYLSTTSIYTYSSNTTAARTDLTYSIYGLAAAGNSTIGVFGGGYASSTLSTTSIYTYSSNTTAAGTDLTYSARGLAAAGNSTLGVFGDGIGPLSTTSIYTYSSNTTAAGANLTYSAYLLAATGNSTLGVFGGGDTSSDVYSNTTYSSTTSIYTYSSNTTAVGTDLTYISTDLAAASSNNVGVI